MFITVTGTPGSGKSAYGVNTIIKKRSEYRNIYANFNGLKMGGNLKPLNFNELKEIITACKDIYDLQIAALGKTGETNVIDAPILDYLLSIDFITKNKKYKKYLKALNDRKKFNIFKRTYLNLFNKIPKVPKYKPNLFLIDEAQNHLPSIDQITGKAAAADPILLWWVSYHRHLYMDVILFAQQYQKIHTSYLRDVQYFLDAVDSDNRLLGEKAPDFKYIKHMATPYYKTNKAGSQSVKKSKEIFDMYESGDAVRTKSAVLPYIYMAAAGAVVLVLVFSYAVSSLGNSTEKDTIETSSAVTSAPLVNTVVKTAVTKPTILSNFSYIKLICISNLCSNKEFKITLDIDDLNATVTNTQSKILSVKKFSDSHGSLTLLASNDFINLFQGAKNGKNKGFNLLN